MYEYDEECLQTFLNMQSQLFDEPVAETLEEAEAFLEDCMAVVVDSIKDVRDYLDESGADISGMSDEELDQLAPWNEEVKAEIKRWAANLKK